MTRDEVIALARDAGLDVDDDEIVQFAAAIGARVKDECAVLLDHRANIIFDGQSGNPDDLSNVILRHHACAWRNAADAIRAIKDKP